MKRYQLYADPKKIELLKKLRNSDNASSLIREAIDYYLEKVADISISTSPTIVHEEVNITTYKEEGDSDDEKEE